MKQFLLLAIACLFLNSVFAQDFIYEGPARSEVRSFWTTAMGIQRSGKIEEGVLTLEDRLAGTRQKDPTYKTADMEAELKKWKDKLASANASKPADAPQADNRSQVQKEMDADKILRSLFENVSFRINQGDLPVMELRIKQYNDKAAEYLALPVKVKPSFNRHYKGLISRSVNETNMAITGMEQALEKGTGPDGVEQNYYLALYYQAYWDAARKIFPEETDYAAEYDKITAFVTRQGSKENMKQGRKNNNATEARNRKLPAAVLKDAALEKDFIEVFNKRYKEEFKGTAFKAVITTSDWQIERNELTGVVTGRTRAAALVYKTTDGTCFLINPFFIHQEYVGGKFLSSKPIYAVYGGNEILCENVK